LNNDNVNQAIREEYGLEMAGIDDQQVTCSICGSENQSGHSESRTCGRPLSLEASTQLQEKLEILGRLAELEEQIVLEKLQQFDSF
jgi:anaerobic ribonucleoside-triphosphate reductase